MDSGLIITLFFLFLVLYCFLVPRRDNFTTGYAVTSGLAFNNRTSYCVPGNEAEGGDFGGGCFVPHRVIV